jgi:Type-IV b secretion system, inner-membrane complex component
MKNQPARKVPTDKRRQVSVTETVDIPKIIERSLWATIGTFLFCIIMALFVFTTKRQDRLLAIQNDAPVQLIYQDTPNTSPEAVTQWASQAITALYNYDMNNIGARIMDAQGYFTETGWTSFLLALKKQGILDTVTASRQILTTVPVTPPLIIKEKSMAGETYEWTVQISVRISIDVGGSSPISETRNITMTIERIPSNESPGGYALGIRKITR